MMKKNLCFTLGILGILLFSLGNVFAASENGFSISVMGAGESTSNRISGNSGANISFNVQFENSNQTYQDVVLRISGTNIVSVNHSVSGNETFSLTFQIPSTQATQSRTITAKVYDSTNTNLLGTATDSVYYTVSDASISGCTDPDATNYNPSATVDDGSCAYEESEYSCSVERGDLDIAYFSVNNMGTGDDEEWNLLDEIELEVEVENKNRDDSVREVLVEIVILNENGEDVTQDFELDDEEIDLGRIRDRESEIATFRIPELPADLEEGTYKIYIKAYSEDDEENQCASTSNDFNKDKYQEIEITREEDPAVFAKSSIIRMDVLCGEKNAIFSFDVYNLGSDDEKRVLVTLENSELGISEKQVISNLRSGKKKEVIFMFDLPDYLPKEFYDLSVKTYFDYDDDEDENDKESYDENSDDIGKRFSLRVNVLGCILPEPTITAKLLSETKIGENLVVEVKVLNNAHVERDVIISAEGYESWGSLTNIEPVAGSISPGQSKDFIITFVPEKEGKQSFKINVLSDSETYERQVSLNIGNEGSFNFWGLDRISFFLIVGIGVLILLIVLILIVKLIARNSKD